MHRMPGLPRTDAAAPANPPEEGGGVPEQREPLATTADAPGAGASQADQAKAYEASVMAAFGGRRGLAEVGLPTIVFIAVYTPTRRLDEALWSAVAVAALLTVVRLVRRDKIQHALSGLFGVAVCAVFARYTGQAKNFYLPGVLLNCGEAVLFSVSALVRWPVVGVVLGPITGEMTAWRDVPARHRAFTRATWMLAAMFVLRVLIEVPLYLGNQTTALGAAKVVLGYPLYLFVAFLCWRVIRAAPLPDVKRREAAEPAD